MPFSPTTIKGMPSSKPAASGDVPKHRACDECRSRKLACSKEADGCARCKREGIPCYYSPQKPMGRPRKRRATDESDSQAPASRRRPSPGIQRSRSASSSAHSTGPEIRSFQLSGTPAPSFSDQNFGFLDHQAGTPDMALFDILPSYYLAMTTASPAGCASTQGFHGALPMAQDSMGIYNDMSFLDPAFASAPHDSQDAFGATPDLSVGSHTPLNSEPSFSPPPRHTRASTQPGSKEFFPTEVLQPIPSVSCPCLSSLYMALESMANLPRDISAAMRVARHASKVAQGVIHCKVCSCNLLDISKAPPMQSFQNMMLLATLVPSACNAYAAIVEMIDRESNLAMQQGRRIFFSMREMGGLWEHQAVSGRALPADLMEFDNTDLGPQEWRRIMLVIIRLDVYGDKAKQPSRPSGSPSMMGLSDVVAALDERSQKRHDLVDASMAAGTLPPHTHYMMTPRSCKPEDRKCLRILEVARMALNSLVIA
ncbi:hypothetical protein LMH87_005550 [Akanthomyces muscarius]|uniref:Zn(2)-C6 fungal-type domain-containing protein n=1 Tax=Akanthomyces muscarius TaxID=2231603 RepID=A0A9W8QKY8_AKAMU|nr:hypothetical protein LMH87_005550 [Akanthomyces muscarius]KAJ4163846.1 hypothetical protein LMH87_005550 [Akanthomyces muscarius]